MHATESGLMAYFAILCILGRVYYRHDLPAIHLMATLKKFAPLLLILISLGFIGAGIFALHGSTFALLDPKGVIGMQERNLIILATLLMAIVVVPVLVLTFVIAWRYRSSNTQATYTPDWDHNMVAESVWWGIPCIIILALAIITWTSSHSLDPAKKLVSPHQPMTIQVVALQWKWLFIYPSQQIATVNFVQFPKDTPVTFELTSDAPMNSFWIPQLGSQIYAMPGMTTHLNLIANQFGSFNGDSANLSGAGFASMKFIAKASSQADFQQWVDHVHTSPNVLTTSSYTLLAKPGEPTAQTIYTLGDPYLFNEVLGKFMAPSTNDQMMGSMNMQ